MNLADLAISYSLNTELLMNTINSHMGTSIHGHMQGGLLYTAAYVRNIKAQLRGALRGVINPMSVPSLIKDLGIQGLGSNNSMVLGLMEELVGEGCIKGSLKAGGGNWVPAVYTAAQQGAVRGFYESNGWVAYDTVRKMGISNDKAYLKGAFPEGIALDTGVLVGWLAGSGVLAVVRLGVLGPWGLDSWQF